MAAPAGLPLEAPVPRNEQRGPVGLSFDQLVAAVPRQPTETYGAARIASAVIKSELDAGRIIAVDADRYQLVPQAFAPDVLEAVRSLALPD